MSATQEEPEVAMADVPVEPAAALEPQVEDEPAAAVPRPDTEIVCADVNTPDANRESADDKPASDNAAVDEQPANEPGDDAVLEDADKEKDVAVSMDVDSPPREDSASMEVEVPAPTVPEVATPEVQAVSLASLAPPEKVKKASSAYWFYSMDMRQKIMDEQVAAGEKPSLAMTAKTMGVRWSALTDDDKKVWTDKAAADKQRYDTEMQAQWAVHDPVASLTAKYRDLIPTKPTTAYSAYMQDAQQKDKAVALLKADGKEVSGKLIAAKLGEIWKSFGAAERAPYQEQQLRENLEFVQKQKEWQSTPEFAELQRVTKEQAAVKKAVEAMKAADEAARLEKEKQEKRRAMIAQRRATAQAKKAETQKADDPTPVKKPRPTSRVSKGAAGPPQPHIDEKVLLEAAKLDMEAGLRNLASRAVVMASGKSSRAILDALKSSNGLVNPAQRTLLGH